MALPIILIDSNSGSDSLASGAGPSTAITGTAASTSGDGLTVTLDSGTDLTNVLTDGSHVIYLVDSTAGARNFGKITGKAGSGGATPTVDVSDAFGLSLSGLSWAIGGLRQYTRSSSSYKLFNNNDGGGDAMPGWTIMMLSGHSESINVSGQQGFDIKRSGNNTDGPITFCGEPNALVKPVLSMELQSSFTNGWNGSDRDYWHLLDFKVVCNNHVSTGNMVAARLRYNSLMRNVEWLNGTNTWDLYGFVFSGDVVCKDCVLEVGGDGIISGDRCFTIGCVIRKTGVASNKIGVTLFQIQKVQYNLIENFTYGISGGFSNTCGPDISHNVIKNCTSHSINISTGNNTGWISTNIINNIIVNSGGYGINLSSFTDFMYNTYKPQIQGNVIYNSSSGPIYPTSITEGYVTTDPDLDDITPQETSLAGVAYPESLDGTDNYAYPGAIQPNATPPKLNPFISKVIRGV